MTVASNLQDKMIDLEKFIGTDSLRSNTEFINEINAAGSSGDAYFVFPPELRSKNTPCIKITPVIYNDNSFISTDLALSPSTLTNYIAGNNGTGNAVTNAVNSEYSTSSHQSSGIKKLSNSVFLPMPPQLQETISPNWEIANADVVKAIQEVLENPGAGQVAKSTRDILAVATAETGIPSKFANVALNPKKQARFNAVDPRSFTFDFTLTAKTEQESSTIAKIILYLRQCVLPTQSDGAIFMGYPCEFEIEFLNVKNFPKLLKTVCTNFNVNYSANTVQVSRDGSPLSISFSMSFTETNILYSNNIL